MRKGSRMTPEQIERLRLAQLRRSGSVWSRFWAKTDASSGIDACWPWLGSLDQDGYGVLWTERTYRRATHIALDIAGRPLSPGQVTRHLVCDNPPCVNPDHLVGGTQAQNIRDQIAKGRHSGSKLSAPDSALIREMVRSGESQRAVAQRFGVSPSNVSRIVSGQVWGEVRPS